MTDEELSKLLDKVTVNAYDTLYVNATYDAVIKFARLVEAAERERWVQAAAVAVQELAGCATWTQGGVTCQALRDLLDKT